MPRPALIAAASAMLAGLLWSARVSFGTSPWGDGAAGLVSAELLMLAAIAAVATLLAPGRWVRVLLAAVAAVHAALAILLAVDPIWVMALTSSVAATGLAWSAWLDEWYRGGIKPDKVPARATLLALGLVVLPGVVGATGLPEVSTAGWVVAAGGGALGWAYSRALPGSLWLARLAVLPAAAAAAIGREPALAVALVLFGMGLTVLAWTADARLAVQPLTPRRVETMSILPEMVPEELMEGAGFDRRGRRKDRS